MFKTIWNTILYTPLYNLLVLLIVLFGGNVGLAVIGLTVLVKAVLLPFTAKTIKSQVAMKAIEPKLQKIREEHATDKQMQSKKTFELYREHKINPFTGCFLLIIQFPIIIALYRVVLGGFAPHPELLYSFVHFPEHLKVMFLGLDVTQKSTVLAVIVTILQFLQGYLMTRANKKTTQVATTQATGFQADMQKSMQAQMKYFLPIMVGFISLRLPAAIGLYWAVNIIVTIAQEYYIRNKYMKVYERNN